MLSWFRRSSAPMFRHQYPPRTEQSARFMALVSDMDKHTLMHCIVVAMADRPDMTAADKAMLVLRLNSQASLSETPRPDRK